MPTERSYTELELMQARVEFVPDGWRFCGIREAFVIRNNLRRPISEEERAKNSGPYPYFGPTKIQGYIGTYEQDGKYALIGEDGDHFLKYRTQPMTQLVEGKCTVNNHAHIIEGSDIASREWFYHYFMHRDIFSFLSRQGAGRYKLNKASLEKIPVLIPPRPEQKKIAQILSTWDQAITATERLLEKSQQRKKGLMQQLLTGKKRLPGCEGEWESVPLRELLIPKKSKSGDGSYPVYSVTKNGLVSQEEYFKKSVAADDLSGYLIVDQADFVMSGLNFWMGSVDVHTKSFPVIVSPAYKVFSLSQKVDASYFRNFIQTSLFKRILEGSSVMGASIVRRNFNRELFMEWPIKLPSITEQEAISSVLDTENALAHYLSSKLLSLKQEKQALMQQLLTGKRRVQVETEAA
ncbi:MAG: restriction endonuclease subunit S [Halomonadaceae bacterium]|uniref:restriction endonuclease subunit S n=1 Tax=Halomonas sp. AOP42-C1-46 TaxID=3457671 RepID=UPI003FBA1AD7